jgi:hypothetical protein
MTTRNRRHQEYSTYRGQPTRRVRHFWTAEKIIDSGIAVNKGCELRDNDAVLAEFRDSGNIHIDAQLVFRSIRALQEMSRQYNAVEIRRILSI